MIAVVKLIAPIADHATKPPMTGEGAIAEAAAKLMIAPEITTAIGSRAGRGRSHGEERAD